MADISGSGVSVRLAAGLVFPQGFQVEEYADDIDPIDHDEWVVGDDGVGLNGNYLFWVVKSPFRVTFSVEPDSSTDINFKTLLQSYRNGNSGIITMTVQYINQLPITYSDGSVISGAPATSVASSQRKKSKSYVLGFSKVSG